MRFAILALLAGLGRWAGGAWANGTIAAALTGVALGYLVEPEAWWVLLLFALAGVAGEAPGTGHPLGHLMKKHNSPCTYELEWYEWEGIRDRPYVGLAVRGAVQGFVYLPLAPVIFPLYIVSWPLAAWAGTRLGGRYSTWQWSEILRHLPVGCVLLII